MKIVTTDRSGIRVISCIGELRLGAGEADLLGACDDALEAGVRRIVLDFVALQGMDSAGVGAVVGCAKHVGEQGGVIKVALHSDSAVGRIFKVVFLDRVFEVFPNSDAAAASFAR